MDKNEPCGHPSKYWPCPTLLNLGDLTRASATNVVWLMQVEIKLGFINFRSIFRLVQDTGFVQVDFLHCLYQVDQEKDVKSSTFCLINNFVLFFICWNCPCMKMVWKWYENWWKFEILILDVLKMKTMLNLT